MEERTAPGGWDSIRRRVTLDLRSGAARPILPQQALPHVFFARFLPGHAAFDNSSRAVTSGTLGGRVKGDCGWGVLAGVRRAHSYQGVSSGCEGDVSGAQSSRFGST